MSLPPPNSDEPATSDAAEVESALEGAAGTSNRIAAKPLSQRWSRVAVVAVALLAGGMLMAVWPSQADPAVGSTTRVGSPIAIATPQPASPSPTPAGSASSAANPTANPTSAAASPAASAPVAANPTASPTATPGPEGALVTGLVENVDGLPNTVVAMGDGPVHGDPSAGVITYSVETDQTLAGEMPALLSTVEATLGNTERGWTAYAPRALQRVGSTEAASIRIVLAPPALVDETCIRVGLDTAGMYSCWDGAHTMLNSDRWFQATPEFSDLGIYRTYLVNHEFGHGLGYDHEYCAGEGMVAPVMQQQTISLQGCVANGWPLP